MWRGGFFQIVWLVALAQLSAGCTPKGFDTGVRLEYRVVPDHDQDVISAQVLRQTEAVLGRRFEEMGVSKYRTSSGNGNVTVELSSELVKDIRRIKGVAATRARLEFCLVDDAGTREFFLSLRERLEEDGLIKLQRERVQMGSAGVDWSYYLETRSHEKREIGGKLLSDFVSKAVAPVDRVIALQRNDALDEAGNPTGEYAWRTFLLEVPPDVSGEHVFNAMVLNDESTGQPYVSLQLSQAGAEIFHRLTKRAVKRRLAIVIDGNVQTAPIINEPIPGGMARITLGGYRTYKELFAEALDLVIMLRSGPLPRELELVSEKAFGPTTK
jgi:preprotein translocase subunit SecD